MILGVYFYVFSMKLKQKSYFGLYLDICVYMVVVLVYLGRH